MSQQQEESKKFDPRWVGPALTLAIHVIGLAVAGGVITAKLSSISDQISALAAVQTKQADVIREIEHRLSWIEGRNAGAAKP